MLTTAIANGHVNHTPQAIVAMSLLAVTIILAILYKKIGIIVPGIVSGISAIVTGFMAAKADYSMTGRDNVEPQVFLLFALFGHLLTMAITFAFYQEHCENTLATQALNNKKGNN